MLNKVMMIGRLTRDPELRRTATGTAITNFSLATNEVWYKEGEKQEKTTFSEWVLWNGSGENMCKITNKGDLIYAEGKFSLEEWTDKEGNVRKTPRFTALSWQLLSKVGGKKVTEGDDENTEEATPAKKRGRPAKTEKVEKPPIEEGDGEDDSIPF